MSKTEDRLDRAAAADGNGSVASGAPAMTTPARGLPLAAYVPMGVTSSYAAPKATVDPDRSKGWIKRAAPIVMAHKVQFFSALIFSFLGLVIQVWIPKILQNGITNALILRTQGLHTYVELIAVLASRSSRPSHCRITLFTASLTGPGRASNSPCCSACSTRSPSPAASGPWCWVCR